MSGRARSVGRDRGLLWYFIPPAGYPQPPLAPILQKRDERRENDRERFLLALNSLPHVTSALTALRDGHAEVLGQYLRDELTNILVSRPRFFPSTSCRAADGESTWRWCWICKSNECEHAIAQEPRGAERDVPGVKDLNVAIEHTARDLHLFDHGSEEGIWVLSAIVSSLANQCFEGMPRGEVVFMGRFMPQGPVLRGMESVDHHPPWSPPSGLDWHSSNHYAHSSSAGALEIQKPVRGARMWNSLKEYLGHKRAALGRGLSGLDAAREVEARFPDLVNWLTLDSVTIRQAAGWDPTLETENAFRARVERYIDDVLVRCVANGLHQSRHKGTGERAASEVVGDRELSWLMRRYCSAISPERISKEDAEAEGQRAKRGTKPVSIRTIEDAIERLRRWLELPKPPSLRRGRKPKATKPPR